KHTVWEFFPREELPRLRKMLDERLRGDSAPKLFETEVVHRDGRRIPVEISTTPVLLGARSANVTFLFDVTHRKNAENALRRSEINFRSLIENAPDGVVILRWPNIAFANPAALRLLGFKRAEDAIGVDLTSRLHPADVERAHTRVDKRSRG